MQKQTGKVLGTKNWGWTARMACGSKVTLLPERGRIMDGDEPRIPKPAEKRPRPQQRDDIVVFGVEQAGQRLLAQQWALQR